MPQPFSMRMADATFTVSPLHEQVRQMCEDYLIPHAAALDGSCPHLDIVVTPELIERERALSTEEEWSDAYLETLAVYRAVAEWAPLHGRLLIHGAAIEVDGRAFLFCAPSGTGKSTHIALWRRVLGDAVRVVNGDKPLVRMAADGHATIFGTPWCGKEGWQENTAAPLAGICWLSRAAGPGLSHAEPVAPANALDAAMRQVYLPKGPEAGAATLELMDRLLTSTPLYNLSVDMTDDAVRVARGALMGGRAGASAPARAGEDLA